MKVTTIPQRLAVSAYLAILKQVQEQNIEYPCRITDPSLALTTVLKKNPWMRLDDQASDDIPAEGLVPAVAGGCFAGVNTACIRIEDLAVAIWRSDGEAGCFYWSDTSGNWTVANCRDYLKPVHMGYLSALRLLSEGLTFSEQHVTSDALLRWVTEGQLTAYTSRYQDAEKQRGVQVMERMVFVDEDRQFTLTPDDILAELYFDESELKTYRPDKKIQWFTRDQVAERWRRSGASATEIGAFLQAEFDGERSFPKGSLAGRVFESLISMEQIEAAEKREPSLSQFDLPGSVTNDAGLLEPLVDVKRRDEWREMILAVISKYRDVHKDTPTWAQFWPFLCDNRPAEYGIAIVSGKKGKESFVAMGDERIRKGNVKRRFERLLKPSLRTNSGQ